MTFAEGLDELDRTAVIQMNLKLMDDRPVNYRPCRLSLAKREQVRKIVAKLRANGIVRGSFSSYASPFLLVKKKTGKMTLCVDYRALNVKTIKKKHPIPLTEDQLQRLAGNYYFTSLDLASGYHKYYGERRC